MHFNSCRVSRGHFAEAAGVERPEREGLPLLLPVLPATWRRTTTGPTRQAHTADGRQQQYADLMVCSM
eukprot:1707133-Prorocentrum_lima.AAC.1